MWCQTEEHQQPEVPGLILEIDLTHINNHHLLPDEDFLAQVARLQKETPPKRSNIIEWEKRMLANQSLWEASLKHLGTCAYRGTIPLEAIRRYALLERVHSNIDVYETAVNIDVHSIMANRQREELRFIFDGIMPTPDIINDTFALAEPLRTIIPGDPEWEALYERKKAFLLAERARSIRVVTHR
jgi:hypothetical protein